MRKQTTIRLPKDLCNKLDDLADNLGFSRTDLIRSAILKYLISDKIIDYEETPVGSGEFVRTVIYLNDTLKTLIKKQADANNTSINSLIIYAASKTYDYYEELLKELNL